MDAGRYVCELSNEERRIAAENLNESDEDRPRKIAEIRRWVLDTDGLRARTDDFFLLRFLRACKFNVEKTKEKLTNYHQQRASMPEWYANRDPALAAVREMLDMGVFLPLKKADNQGRMVVIVRTAVHDPSKHELADMLKASLMVLDVATRHHEPVTINGITAILDIEGLSIGHVWQLPPHIIKKLVHAWQGCYPLRIQSMDFINAPSFVNVVLNIFKSFMHEKLKRRVHVHMRRTKPFSPKIPASILPTEYGGTDGPLQDLIDYWKKVVEDNRDWFADDEQYKMTS